jgi:DNA-binding MarR family transcriptional regulator
LLLIRTKHRRGVAIPDADEPLSDRELATWIALAQTVDTIRDFLSEQLRDGADLSLMQYAILEILDRDDDGTLRMTDIADTLVASRSGITYQVRRLADRGLVTRHGSLVDERSVEVSITDQGRRRLERLRPAHTSLLKHLMFKTVTGERLDDLAQLVADLQEYLRGAPPRSARRRTNRSLRDGGFAP